MKRPSSPAKEDWRLQNLTRIGALALERLQAEARLAETALLFRDLARAVRDLAEAADEDVLVARLFQWAARLGPLHGVVVQPV